MVNYPRPATDPLPSPACQSLSSSSGHLHSHKVDTKCPDKLPLYLIRPRYSQGDSGVCTDVRYPADSKLSESINRHQTLSKVNHSSHSSQDGLIFS